MTRQLAQAYPVQVVCQTLGCPRSSYYYRGQPRDEAALQAALKQAAGAWPTYGYRRLTAQLQRAGWVINSKRVRRLMRQLGLLQKQRAPQRRTTQSDRGCARYLNLVQDLGVTQPDQVWVSDITYIRLHREFVYLAVIMDVFTRSIRGWQLSRSLDQELTLTALQRALARSNPQIHHSDQGIQYAAPAYVEALQQAGIAISMAAVGAAWQNGYAERLIRTIKEEEVQLAEYRNFTEAYAQIGQFLEEVYQRKRIHSALGYLTPAEFEAVWRDAQAEACPEQSRKNGLLPKNELQCVQL